MREHIHAPAHDEHYHQPAAGEPSRDAEGRGVADIAAAHAQRDVGDDPFGKPVGSEVW